jgi:ribosome-associated toxin RatA of RatAB toxin-antitoxin module
VIVMQVTGEHEERVIGARPERCLTELSRVEDYPEWYPGVRHVDVRSRDGEQRPLVVSLVIYTGMSRFGEIPLELQYEWRSDPPALAWRRIGGAPTRLDALWRLTADEGGTRVGLTFDLEIHTKMPGFVERQLGLHDKIVELMIRQPPERLAARAQERS